MAWPSTPLDIEVSLALSADLTDPGSWSWTDITAYVRENNRIRIRRGRSSERSTIPPSRCTLTVDNTDGRFCRFLPTGAWYGQIGPNTPIRVRMNNGSGYVTRFVGYVSGWPPSWDPSESDQTVSLTADGILRRLGQGRVLRSPLFRSITGTSPSAYWPLEDESGSSAGASGLAGRAALAGSASFGGASLVPAGSAAAMDLSAGGFLVASTGLSAGPVASWEMEGVFGWETIPSTSAKANQIAGFTTPGSAVTEWGIGTFESAGTLRFGIYRVSSGGVSIGFSSQPILAGVLYHFRIRMEQNGADVDYTRWLDGVQVGSGSEVGVTLYAPTLARVNGESSDTQMPHSISHLAVWAPVRSTFDTYLAVDGWSGEQAHERVDRLCTEEGIAVTVTATGSQAMGSQRSNTLVALLRECATTDFGLLYEPADAAGLAFLSSTERFNQAAAITLQYDQGHVAPPWDPTDDDRDTRNDVTASRPGGSSARVTDEASIAAIGVYDDTLSVNTETDEQLDDVAGWAVNLGTVDELRWPAVKPNFLDHPSLIDDWMAADLGSQLHVTGHPSPLAPDEIEQIIEGYEETFGSFEYTVVANLSPASGWTVAELDDDDLGKLDTDGSELITAVNSSATMLTVLTSNVDSPLWTTDSGEMPIPLIVAGEVMSVTDVDPAFLDNFGRVTASGWGTSDSGHAWTTTGGAAADYSTTGSRGQIAFTAAGLKQTQAGDSYDDLIIVGQVLPTEVSTGAPVDIGLTVRRNSSSNDCYELLVRFETTSVIAVRVNKVVAGAASNIAANAVGSAYSAGSIFWIKAALQGDRIRVKAWNTSASEPDWHLDFTDSSVTAAGQIGAVCRVQGGNTNIPVSPQWDAIQVTNPQVMTVTRSVNGVAKSQSAGTAVNVYRPARLAL